MCTEHPYIRAVFTARMYSCIFDTRTYGTGRMYGPYVRVVRTGHQYVRPVYTARTKSIVRNAFRLYGSYYGSVYRAPVHTGAFLTPVYRRPVYTGRIYGPYSKNSD